MEDTFDLAVVGGGINGAGIAADAAGRGLRVLLLEAGDLACATSSVSSKLIHGGLRYLEHYEFRLVREALKEREVLLKIAPHITWPLRFKLPHRPHLRPAWMIRAGLFLYDHLSPRNQLPSCRWIHFKPTDGLQPDMTRGFEYSDVWVDDARLVILNAMRAREKGAIVLTHTPCERAVQKDHYWSLQARQRQANKVLHFKAKGLVNACGPWAAAFFQQQLQQKSPKAVRHIKGSHIIVPKIHDRPDAFILQNEDGRIVFVLPYESDYSLIGTTDVPYQGDLNQIQISPAEIHYLCQIVNQHFIKTIHPSDVIWSYAGVRPLCDDESMDPKAITRDYTLTLNHGQHVPLLSIFGGKITTYRQLAQSALRMLQPFYPKMRSPWTNQEPLPGGDLNQPVINFAEDLCHQYTWLKPSHARRIAHAYGSRVSHWLNKPQGRWFASQITQAEVDYLITAEWATCAEDILWRRSKLGLRFSREHVQELEQYVAQRIDVHQPSQQPSIVTHDK